MNGPKQGLHGIDTAVDRLLVVRSANLHQIQATIYFGSKISAIASLAMIASAQLIGEANAQGEAENERHSTVSFLSSFDADFRKRKSTQTFIELANGYR